VRWWNHSSLRTKIFLAFSALILAVLLATLGLTQLVVSRDAQQTLARELQTTGQVFESFMKERAARLLTNSTLLASDFALKRVIATHFDPVNYDPATLASAGLSYRQRIGVELVWMTDEAGKLLAASPASRRVNQSITELSALKEALQTALKVKGEWDVQVRELAQVNADLNRLNLDQDRIRKNLRETPKDAEVYQTYLKKLSDQEKEIDALAARQKKLMTDEFAARKKYDDYLANIAD